MQLTDHEKKILAGAEGRLKQVALENIVKYGEVVGAEKLCQVTKAHLYCGAHNYLKVCGSDDFHKVFSVMQLARPEETVAFSETDPACFAQSDVSISDFKHYEPRLNQAREVYEQNQHYLDMARQAGVMVVGSCAPYLTGWLPVAGEHFVSTESSVTMTANSLWGARGNSDGIEAAFWSAICGRTPEFGLHLVENRAGTHLFTIEARLESMADWDLLGKAVGRKLPPNGVPVLIGRFPRPDFNQLRQFLTTLAISGNGQLCHLVGLTPEAPTLAAAFQNKKPEGEITITDEDLGQAYELICSPGEGPVDLVSFGCPHYDLAQIKDVAGRLKGRRVHPGVKLMIWTTGATKFLAEANGLAAIIEAAGGALYAGSCPTTVGPELLEPCRGLVFDSFKMAFSSKNMIDRPVYFGDVESCLRAAESGQWQSEFRWQPRGASVIGSAPSSPAQGQAPASKAGVNQAKHLTFQGRGVVPGVVEGPALVCPGGLSAYGGVDVETGVITDFENINYGRTIKGSILILPSSKGSNGWSSSFTAAKVAGIAPAGWAFTQVDSSVGVAVTTLGIPAVVDFQTPGDPCQEVATGDWVRLDGNSGLLTIITSPEA